MKIHKLKNITLYSFLAILITGCTETYPLLTNTYEEAIVVEATLTNELKNQEIKITKTSKFEDTATKIESGAKVIVKDNLGNEYIFEENSGTYISQNAFQILSGREYTLEITTLNGKIYQSSTEVLPTESPIQTIEPVVATNKDLGKVVQINVKSYDPTRTSNYYRYEYEETYKIIAPRWTSLKINVTGPESIELVQNSPLTKTCYSTKKSTDIILFNTNNQAEDRVNLPIRFIEENNYIIGHRYSILVKQYVETLGSYTFHKTMRDIAGSSSILSPKQPGLISGNLKCINDPNKKAIGYFSLNTVSSLRIFFNYTDMFPDNSSPYFNTCEDIPFLFCFRGDSCEGETMIYNLERNLMVYNSNFETKYQLVDAECGDCTSFSSNIIPSFWTE